MVDGRWTGQRPANVRDSCGISSLGVTRCITRCLTDMRVIGAGNVAVGDNITQHDCDNNIVGRVTGDYYASGDGNSSAVLKAMEDYNAGFAALSACPVTDIITSDQLAMGNPFKPGVYKVNFAHAPPSAHLQINQLHTVQGASAFPLTDRQ